MVLRMENYFSSEYGKNVTFSVDKMQVLGLMIIPNSLRLFLNETKMSGIRNWQPLLRIHFNNPLVPDGVYQDQRHGVDRLHMAAYFVTTSSIPASSPTKFRLKVTNLHAFVIPNLHVSTTDQCQRLTICLYIKRLGFIKQRNDFIFTVNCRFPRVCPKDQSCRGSHQQVHPQFDSG